MEEPTGETTERPLSDLSLSDLHRALEDEARAAADEEGMDSTRL
jgi:hypothetical protein